MRLFENSVVSCLLLFLLMCSCKKEDKRYLVVSKVKTAAKLVTTKTTIDKIVLGTQEKRLLGFIRLNQARFVAYTQATVLAGVDLDKLMPGDVKVSGKRIEITFPAVEVLDFSYPFSTYRIDSSITENKFLNSLDILDHENFYRQAELDIRNNLKYMGIRQATEDKTRLLMTGLLKNLDYEEIYISFKQSKEIIQEVTFETDTANVE